MQRLLTTAALAGMLAGSASAATVSNTLNVGDLVNQSVDSPPETLPITFEYTANEPLRVSTIALSATGNNSGADLGTLQMSFFRDGTLTAGPFDGYGDLPGGFIGSVGDTSTGGGFLTTMPFNMNTGDMFTIEWADGTSESFSVTTAFSTSVIPVPAALPLLVGAIGTLGFVRRQTRT